MAHLDNYTIRCMNSWPIGEHYGGLDSFLTEENIKELGWVDTGKTFDLKGTLNKLYKKEMDSTIECNWPCERCHCTKCYKRKV